MFVRSQLEELFQQLQQRYGYARSSISQVERILQQTKPDDLNHEDYYRVAGIYYLGNNVKKAEKYLEKADRLLATQVNPENVYLRINEERSKFGLPRLERNTSRKPSIEDRRICRKCGGGCPIGWCMQNKRK